MAINNEITDTTPLWWEIQNIPTQLIRELRRRNNSNNIGMNIPNTNVTFDFENSFKKYKGPMTPWVRIFSNSTGKSINSMVPRSLYLNKNNQEVDYDGFILNGGEGFYNAYGYTPGKKFGGDSQYAILGYQANGKPHYIDNRYRSQYMYNVGTDSKFPQDTQSPSILPPPAIISVSVKQSKEYLTYGRFSFKCFSLAQLEYLTPFFLTAGINVFIEFGWNLFNQQSLLNLDNIDDCLNIVRKPQIALDRAILSNGNYGCITGIITKFQFNTEDGFVYKCDVETISRQGLYAGMKTDNNAKTEINTSNKEEYKDIMDLRTFIKLYLPSINEVLRQKRMMNGNDNPANFLNYIIVKSILNPPSTTNGKKQENDTNANIEQTQTNAQIIIDKLKKLNINTTFYGGKSEDRVFTGRLKEIYLRNNKPDSENEVISYGKVGDKIDPNLSSGNEQISFVNEYDFDSKDGATDVWLQLDFVFEILNLFMSNLVTKRYKIDISDVIINAHPNLISCDKNVLIPNPIAPKVNYGRQAVETPSRDGFSGGFLKGNSGLQSENAFLVQKPDIRDVRSNVELDKKIKNDTLDYKNLTEEESLYLAFEAARKTFKTNGQTRDNLDVIINYLYYHINDRHGTPYNTSIDDTPIGSAAFPFKKDEIVTRKGVGNKDITVKYKKFYYGYLKHIYISKEKLIDLVKSEDTKNYKQFINSILNVVNESVDNFWKFEIQEGVDKDGNSVISISDKNTINFDLLKEIYSFELGKTNNVVRNINFDVSLSNEQAVNVLYGGPNSNNLTDTIRSGISTGKTTLNIIDNTPRLKFNDRLDQYELRELFKQNEGQEKTLVPGTSSDLTQDNNEIADLQTYGEKIKSGVLMMTVKNKIDDSQVNVVTTTRQVVGNAGGLGTIQRTTYETQVINDEENNPKNYKLLCLPSTLKNKLRQMLEDNDYKNNIAKYSGVADNFTITLTLDGIFALRNLQCFAISNLPKPYVPGNVIFQILEAEHIIEAGSWKTVVTALVRCLGGTSLIYKPI